LLLRAVRASSYGHVGVFSIDDIFVALGSILDPSLLLRIVQLPGLLWRLDDLLDMWMGEDTLLDHAAEFVHRHGLFDRLLVGITDNIGHQTLYQAHLLLAFDSCSK